MKNKMIKLILLLIAIIFIINPLLSLILFLEFICYLSINKKTINIKNYDLTEEISNNSILNLKK